MADNVTTQQSALSTVPDGTIIATDVIGGVQYQRAKLVWGVDGVATDASATNPLPVISTGISITPSSQLTVANSSSTAVIGSVLPSSQWTVSVAPTTQWTVSVTPTTQITVANSSSTSVIGSVMPSSQWSVAVTSSTAVIGSVLPSSQWTMTTTPSSQATVSVTPSSQFTVANSSSTSVIGAVMPSTQWTVSVTPTTQFTVALSSGAQVIGSVAPSSQWTIAATQATTSWTINPNFKSATSLTNATVSCSSTGVGGANILVTGLTSGTVRLYRGSLIASAAVTLGIYDSSSTAATTLASIPLSANGSFSFNTSDSGDPLFVTASSGALAINLSVPAQVRGFIQYIQST